MREYSLYRWIASAGSVLATAASVCAQPLFVPNGSFESPGTSFVETRIDGWQKTARPVGYDESGGFGWDQLTGVFRNPEPGEPDRIGNLDGVQALYLFAVPAAGLFQDAVGAGATFGIGKSYHLTAGMLGGGGGMAPGASIEMSLYYRGADGGQVVVAATNVVHDPSRFPNPKQLVDVGLRVPTVRSTDAWSGRPMGIRFLSTVDPGRAGGYWEIDHVRLVEGIEIPNGSFESPVTAFVDNRVDSWQKTPRPSWYEEAGGFTWDQLSGVFRNTEPGQDDHLENADGDQAFYLFAVPSVGVYLDETSTHETAEGAAAAFAGRFEAGRSYELTLGVQGGGGGMKEGATLELGVYYRDEEGARQWIATTVVTHTAATFPSRQRLTDFRVRTAPVRSTDAWAGRGIGLQVLSTVSSELAGGYWNLDHARMEVHGEPGLRSPRIVDGRLGFVLQSDPGLVFEVLRANDVVAPVGEWTTVGSITNDTGWVEFSDPIGSEGRQFYRVRQHP
ncbi:MAG: hypothetical protein KF833_05620 [Verrucomicrobiae bacterium]|nr:hypothetical protein [Verrucomicrobiae bacterium]